MVFRYPLQKLVDLKGNEKDQAQWLLSEAIDCLRREEAAMDVLLAERKQAGDRLHESSAGRTTISEIQMLQQYLDYLDSSIRERGRSVKSAEADVAVRQRQLGEKMMEEEVWTQAKERARQQFVAVVLKKEQDQLDEIALTRRAQLI